MTISTTDPPAGPWALRVSGKRPRLLHAFWRAFVASLLMPLSVAAGEEPEVSKEYQVKAAYLFNFVKYVEWPADRFANAESPIVVGVLGRNPFATEFDRIVENRTVNGRAVRLRELRTPDEAGQVHLLFVPAGEEMLFGDVAGSLQSVAVVTVGESDRFTTLAGMITFTRAADKVRFSINLATADHARIKISAQLLKLATEVRRKS